MFNQFSLPDKQANVKHKHASACAIKKVIYKTALRYAFKGSFCFLHSIIQPLLECNKHVRLYAWTHSYTDIHTDTLHVHPTHTHARRGLLKAK